MSNAQHTPGPWAWMGNQHGVYLATTHSGRRYVMGFRRMGLNGAQPTFQVDQRMVPASELVRFDVGDGTAKGFAQGKDDPSVYRYDIASIDAPDAHLIAAAPELREALTAAVAELKQSAEFFGPCDHDVGACCCQLYSLIDCCEAALAKAGICNASSEALQKSCNALDHGEP